MLTRTPRNSSRMVPSSAALDLMENRAALSRAHTYPLSLPEYRASPFTINAEGDKELQHSHAFQKFRRALASRHNARFCRSHVPSTTFSAGRWLLHRDIIHALLSPLVHIHERASVLASRVPCTLDATDRELAFRGEARGVFSWLQCLILEEEDWLYTRGCPACVVLHVIQNEPSMRLVLAAARLAKTFRGGCGEWIAAEGLLGNDCGCGGGSESGGRHDPVDQEKDMPDFQFWRRSLHGAIESDSSWGPEIAAEIEERATRVEKGFMALIAQSCALEEIVAMIDQEDEEMALGESQLCDEEEYPYDASPVNKDVIHSPSTGTTATSASDPSPRTRSKGSPRMCFTPYHGHEGEVGIIRRGSALAERSMQGLGATVAGRRTWLNRVIAQGWTTLLESAPISSR